MAVALRACTGPFQPIRSVHVYVGPWTWLHVPVLGRLGFFLLAELDAQLLMREMSRFEIDY